MKKSARDLGVITDSVFILPSDVSLSVHYCDGPTIPQKNDKDVEKVVVLVVVERVLRY